MTHNELIGWLEGRIKEHEHTMNFCNKWGNRSEASLHEELREEDLIILQEVINEHYPRKSKRTVG
jgi:hypothetical protein